MNSVDAIALGTTDQEQIRAVLRAYEQVWNRHDMTSLPQLFTEDADWINIVGMHWRGRQALVHAHDEFHKTFFRKMAITIVDIAMRPLAAGVAVAVVPHRTSEFTAPDGTPWPAGLDLLSVIMVNRAGEWKIAHAHNTVVKEEAQRFDPNGNG